MQSIGNIMILQRFLVPTLPDERWITGGRSASSSWASGCKDGRLKCWIYWVGNLYLQLTQLTENNCKSPKDIVPKAFLPLRPGAAAVPMQTPAQFPVTFGIKRCVLKV